jgi:hypothetical protein
MASHKIPKHVAQELKRHVQKSSSNNNNNNKTIMALLGCVAFTGLAAAMPYLATKWTGNLNAKDDPLTAAQVRRGAFTNSGTRDVGKDPNWDFQTGTYKHSPEHLEKMRQQQQQQQQYAPHNIQHDEEEIN